MRVFELFCLTDDKRVGLENGPFEAFVLAVCASAQVLRPPQQRKRKLIVRRLASASFQATQCVRLAAEVGLGTASLATAVRVGRAYGSEVWTSETEICRSVLPGVG